MGFFQQLVRNYINRNSRQYGDPYEFCPRCDANLTLQKGYSNEYPYWICKGCGEMLINPAVDAEDDIAWICDECSAMLNIQEGFSTDCGCWKCTECGFENKIDSSEIYVTEDEYQAALHDVAKGGIAHMGGFGLAGYVKNHMGQQFFDRFVSAAATEVVIEY